MLNHILSNQQWLRSAVLVNEFGPTSGEVGIDNELVVVLAAAAARISPNGSRRPT